GPGELRPRPALPEHAAQRRPREGLRRQRPQEERVTTRSIIVGKGWSCFFGAVLFGTFIIWPASVMFGWWLPENVASFGGDVDQLFYLILGFTTFFFVLTEMVLVYAMWKFASPTQKIGDATDQKSIYTHGNHRLEILWTVVPAAILLFIAVAQVSVWERIKYQKSMPSPDLTIGVMARQWEWRMRYPVKP